MADTDKDPIAEYDQKHGDPAKNADFAKLADLKDGANKAPPSPVPFKITKA